MPPDNVLWRHLWHNHITLKCTPKQQQQQHLQLFTQKAWTELELELYLHVVRSCALASLTWLSVWPKKTNVYIGISVCVYVCEYSKDKQTEVLKTDFNWGIYDKIPEYVTSKRSAQCTINWSWQNSVSHFLQHADKKFQIKLSYSFYKLS